MIFIAVNKTFNLICLTNNAVNSTYHPPHQKGEGGWWCSSMNHFTNLFGDVHMVSFNKIIRVF